MIINANTYDDRAYHMELIWENDDPSTVFRSSTNLQLNVSEYKLLYISFYSSNTQQDINTQMFAPQFDKITLSCVEGSRIYCRTVYIENSYLMFGNGHYCVYSISDGSVSEYDDDSYVIPYRIYGVY